VWVRFPPPAPFLATLSLDAERDLQGTRPSVLCTSRSKAIAESIDERIRRVEVVRDGWARDHDVPRTYSPAGDAQTLHDPTSAACREERSECGL
jgi:hypothetical protein